MNRTAARAGLLPHFIAFAIDLLLVSLIMSLIGVWFAGLTDGKVRIHEVIGGRMHCTIEDGTPDTELRLRPDAKIDQTQRCTHEFFGVPYDWSRLARVRIAENNGTPSRWEIDIFSLDPLGHTTRPFYIDGLTILLFGLYAFLVEWQFGATLGKRLLGIQVRSLTAIPFGPNRAAKRTIMRVAAFVPIMVFSVSSTVSTTFASSLQHPAGKVVTGAIGGLWLAAFVVNFVVATARDKLPWHDRWAETEVILKRSDRKPQNVRDLPARSSPVPPWLIRRDENQ